MAYQTPDEARASGQAWMPRAGEPADLRDPYHYQSPDEAKSVGREWATQAAFLGGRGPGEHAGIQALAQQYAGSGRLGDLLGYGYDDYTGPIRPGQVASGQSGPQAPGAGWSSPWSYYNVPQPAAQSYGTSLAPRVADWYRS